MDASRIMSSNESTFIGACRNKNVYRTWEEVGNVILALFLLLLQET
jgi:hypothetical protein